MGLYALGKAGAISAVIAAVEARVTEQADGTLILDRQSLNEYLWAQANIVIEDDVAPANQAAAKAVLATINGNPDLDRITFVYSPDNWNSRASYPTAQGLSQQAGFIPAYLNSYAESVRLAEQIENFYVDLNNRLPTFLSEIYEETGAAANIPPTEQRIVDTRFYIFTWVNDEGWESAPSLVSDMAETAQKDVVTLTRSQTPPTGFNIVGFRVYRSNVGTQSAAFQLVAPVEEGGAGHVWEDGVFKYYDLTVTTGQDGVLPSQLGEICPTTTWLPPPANLKGVVPLPNGMIAGYFDNTVCFCEPYYPYAWPVEYQITVESPIVALGSFGQTVVVFHRRGIDYISGADSASMSMQKDVSQQVCITERTLAHVEGGVAFSSADGLCLASSQGVVVLTEGRINRDDWLAIDLQNSALAYSEGSVYVLANNAVYSIHIPTRKVTSHVFARSYSSIFHERMNDAIYGASGTSVYKLFSGASKTGRWKSKIAVLEKQAGFAWLVIESDFSAPITVRWYGDGVLRHTATVTSRTPVRLPVGRWLEHEVEVETTARWNSLTMASSGDELRGV
jgi:hypothetical protein